VGDLDVLVVADAPGQLTKRFAQTCPDVANVLMRGPQRASVVLKSGIQVDVRVVAPRSFGAALQYFTGPARHNVTLRAHAKRCGLKLNEYGLFRGTQRIAGDTEASVYDALNLTCPTPEKRV
jgi:DNA polymerase (family 10)